MLQKFIKSRLLAGMLIGVIIAAITSIFSATGSFNSWHLKIADTLYTNNSPSKDIVIIAIDNTSTESQPTGLGRFSQWTRDNYVKLLEQLGDSPSVITFDITFNTWTENISIDVLKKVKDQISQATSDIEKDAIYEVFFDSYASITKNPIDTNLANSFKQHDNIVLAFIANETELILPLTKFTFNTLLGNASNKVDSDSIIRTVTPIYYFKSEDKYYSDLALSTVRRYLQAGELEEKDISDEEIILRGKEKETKIPLEKGELNVNFFGDPFTFEMIPFVDVINGDFQPGFFKDKIALIGVTEAKEIQDTVATPRSDVYKMSGVEFHANEIQTILDEAFLLNQALLSQILTLLLISILLAISLNYLNIIFSVVVIVAALIGYYLAAHLAYKNGLILNMVYPFMAIFLTYIASWVYKFFIADKGKREMKSAFGHYVSDKLVEEISKNPDMVKLGGEKRVVTVFFSDIKDSTKISESTEISTWVSQINEYFTVMEGVIKKWGGTVDKYEGDAIMGFFNAPTFEAQHVSLAYACALEMRKALSDLNKKWEAEGKQKLEFRMGINTGDVIVGNFGSTERFDYTVMGDTVNTASRLESSANKTYGTSIICAGFQEFQNEEFSNFVLRDLDTVYLPGKNEPIQLYELVCLQNEKTTEIEGVLKSYELGLKSYREKDFATAIMHFEKNKNDLPSSIMFARAQKLASGEALKELDEKMVYRISNK